MGSVSATSNASNKLTGSVLFRGCAERAVGESSTTTNSRFPLPVMCITDRSAVVQCSELQESRHSQAGLGAFRAYVMDPARAVIQQRRDTRRSNPNMWPKSAVVNENVWRRVLLFSHPGRTHGCLVLPQRSFPSGTVSLARTAGAEMGLNAAELVQNTVVYAPATG